MAVLQAYRSWSSIWNGEYFGIRVLCGIAADAQPYLQRLPGGTAACGRSVLRAGAVQSDQFGAYISAGLCAGAEADQSAGGIRLRGGAGAVQRGLDDLSQPAVLFPAQAQAHGGDLPG